MAKIPGPLRKKLRKGEKKKIWKANTVALAKLWIERRKAMRERQKQFLAEVFTGESKEGKGQSANAGAEEAAWLRAELEKIRRRKK